MSKTQPTTHKLKLYRGNTTPLQINKNELEICDLKANTPLLFEKKSKNIVIKPLTYIRSDTGKTKHFTPAAQE